MPRKFDQDAKDRVVRLVEDRILAENISMQVACKIVAPKLGVSWHTARQWTQADRREGRVTERLHEGLVTEVSELRRVNLPDVKHPTVMSAFYFAWVVPA